MKKLFSLLGASTLAAGLVAGAASAQQISNADLIGNGDKYGAPQGVAPHFLVQPLTYGLGESGSFELNGNLGFGGRWSRANAINTASGMVDGGLSATLRQTTPQGWTFGATLSADGSASYTVDAADPFDVNLSTDSIQAYAFIDTPTLDVEVGRFSPGGIETSGEATLNGVVNPVEADFSSSVGGNLAGSIGTRQGPWDAKIAADINNRQYGAVMWRRPVRTITPAYGIEVIRDGEFDFANTPLTGGLAVGTGQLYGGRAGAMVEYGRLTFGASAGLEGFYDGTTLIEAQSFYDLGVSNKSGRFIYGVSAQHRRSHQAEVNSTSIAADMTIGIATGVDLELGYEFTRFDDEFALEPEYSQAAKADVRVSF